MSAFSAALAALVISLTLSQPGDVQSPPKIVHESGFIVIGISARTSNAKESSGQGVIGEQWTRFLKDGLLNKIPNKVDRNILAVYTDYESDANGPYTYILGARVSSTDDIPPGMISTKVPSGRYAVFTSEKGPVERVVPGTWRRIWTVPKSSPGGNRAYLADFELYDQRTADPQNSQVDIYIGIN
ncbi:MAG: GyrI-like domain-containing protein [Candidatus Acidiferrum sp.]